MKTEVGNRIRLGIFVSIGLTLFIIVIYFIGDGRQMFTKTIHINGVFRDLGGLQPGNNVRFTGMNVGTVGKIEIVSDTTVKVDMIIEKRVQQFIKQDAIATIGSDGLMGSKVINLLAGGNDTPIIENGATLQTITPASMEDIMADLAVTSKNAAHITSDISILTASVKDGHGPIGRLFMDSSMAQTLNQTLVNAKNAAGGFSENMEAAKHNFLLRGYYKKKEKAEEKIKKDSLDIIKNAKKEN